MIHWAEACNDIETEWATHCYYHATEDRPGLPSSLIWSHRPDCTAAHSFGTLIGYDYCEREWTLGINEGFDAEYPEMLKRFPEIEKEAGRTSMLGLHCICSSVIEVAEDGKSAQTSFYTPGLIGRNTTIAGKKMSFEMWERYGQDWLFEDGDDKTGQWRVLHNRVAEDFSFGINSKNYAAMRYEDLMATGRIVARMLNQDAPRNIERLGPTHMNYSPVQVVQDGPWIPVPYKTLDETTNNIPEEGSGERFIKVFDLNEPKHEMQEG